MNKEVDDKIRRKVDYTYLGHRRLISEGAIICYSQRIIHKKDKRIVFYYKCAGCDFDTLTQKESFCRFSARLVLLHGELPKQLEVITPHIDHPPVLMGTSINRRKRAQFIARSREKEPKEIIPVDSHNLINGAETDILIEEDNEQQWAKSKEEKENDEESEVIDINKSTIVVSRLMISKETSFSFCKTMLSLLP